MNYRVRRIAFQSLALWFLVLGCSMGGWAGWTDPASDKTRDFSVLIRGGTLYDGSGSAGRIADLGIQGDRIVALGDL